MLQQEAPVKNKAFVLQRKVTMSSHNEPAEPIAEGIWAVAKQSWVDLFRWRQRVEIINEHGEKHAEWQDPDAFQNPIKLFMLLSARDWLFFLVGLAAWTADAFDFHALSIQQVKLADYYGRTKTDISTAITLTLLLRSVGAAFFGLAGDRWGRKWPMVVNMIVLGVLQIATIYSGTFQQFLAVRSLFGLFMGGVYGNAIAMALEHCPYVSLLEKDIVFDINCCIVSVPAVLCLESSSKATPLDMSLLHVPTWGLGEKLKPSRRCFGLQVFLPNREYIEVF